MKTPLKSYFIAIVCVSIWLISCRKEKTPFPDELSAAAQAQLTEPDRSPGIVNIDSLLALETNGAIPFPVSGSYNCKLKKPLYKESLLYNKSGSSNDFIVKAENELRGKYYSWPKGLHLDSITGAINVSASQGGIKYTVGFVQTGYRDTCLQDIVLSGASYVDSIYVLGKNDSLAYPYFNANLATASICNVSGDEDYPGSGGKGDDKCEFDAEDNKGKKGRANEKKVKVRTVSGVINLKKTLADGAFGSANPVNGQGLIVPVYYKLADQSAKALQKVNVQLIFFDKKSDIPVALLNYIQRKQTSIRGGRLISAGGDPRPPLVIITRS